MDVAPVIDGVRSGSSRYGVEETIAELCLQLRIKPCVGESKGLLLEVTHELHIEIVVTLGFLCTSLRPFRLPYTSSKPPDTALQIPIGLLSDQAEVSLQLFQQTTVEEDSTRISAD